ncbi:MAG: hypothetical protein GWO02_19580, partial [Gammaproteobacteria bacterium]|nr:hypothetical protein [Gammaproteobacteria bacterium]
PVYVYIDNFLELPVGVQVPSGYYDPDAAGWKTDRDGYVIEILDESAGRAVLDTD